MMAPLQARRILVPLVRYPSIRRFFSSVSTPLPHTVVSDDITPTPVVDPGPVEIIQISKFIASKKKLIVITGAGCSTESGVPDYRSPNGSYSKGHKPTTYQDFVNKPLTRKRSMFGFLFFNQRDPNPTHTTLAALEKEGHIHHLITQNVDRLHHKAGQQRVIELHGNNETISKTSRADYQVTLQKANPDWMTSFKPPATSNRPDGDTDLGLVDYSKFVVPDCDKCGGMLKPEVVFFGENVPLDIVKKAMDLIHESDGVLAIGSSLQVFSVYRFVKAADQLSIPVAILNIGPTRADELPSLEFKVEGRCGVVLPLVHEALKTNSVTDVNY